MRIGKGLCLVAGHGTEAAGGDHQNVGSEKLVLFVVGEYGAEVAHVNDLIAVPIEYMYPVLAPKKSPARVMEGVDIRQLVGAGLGRIGYRDGCTVVAL